MDTREFFATAPKNIETLLAEELRAIGIRDARDTRGGALFNGPLVEAYRACLWSRVASRVLMVLKKFPAASPEELYAGIREINWQEHFSNQETFAIDANCANSTINHSHFAALKCKDAIVDQFRELTGQRPSIAPMDPDIRLNLYIFRDQATISLDLSGSPLNRRGWRKNTVLAPLKENLAAAILLRAGWPEIAASGGCLVDPMCGSGTFAIEAAMIAGDIAPGIFRKLWGFSKWRGHEPKGWQELLQEALARREAGLPRIPAIRGYDHDHRAVRAAIDNVAKAGLTGPVHIERREIINAAPVHPDDRGLVIINPPYGERLEDEAAIIPLYQRIGRSLKQNFRGWKAALFTGRPDLGHAVGLRSHKSHALYNGAIPCRLLHFEIEEKFFRAYGPGPSPMPKSRRSPGAEMFANRLRKNLKRLEKWRKRNKITCFRAYDADLPEYNLALDLYYGDDLRLVVQEYEAPKSVAPEKAKERLREALGEIIDILEADQSQLFIKVRRRQKGKRQYEKLDDEKTFHRIEEGGCRFLINFTDYIDTGIFLDHRPTRAMIQEKAAGKDFLNLFAYTGTATVMAAKGGARSTTSVDLSNTYLDWARRNMAENDFKSGEHRYLREDCLKWLKNAARDKKRYGLIFLDPPSFSASKKMAPGSTLDIQRDHGRLINEAAALLAPEGELIFSTNLRGFKMDKTLSKRFACKDISRATIPEDFKNSPKVHQCWLIRLS